MTTEIAARLTALHRVGAEEPCSLCGQEDHVGPLVLTAAGDGGIVCYDCTLRHAPRLADAYGCLAFEVWLASLADDLRVDELTGLLMTDGAPLTVEQIGVAAQHLAQRRLRCPELN